LWCSWVVKTPNKRLYFAGDTGYHSIPRSHIYKYHCNPNEISYDPHYDHDNQQIQNLPKCPIFKELGEKYNGFDLALLPIGAYSPRWYASCCHLSPYDACRVHLDIKSKKTIGIHYGTFILTDEQIEEPITLLKEMKTKLNIPADEFITVDCGETILI